MMQPLQQQKCIGKKNGKKSNEDVFAEEKYTSRRCLLVFSIYIPIFLYIFLFFSCIFLLLVFLIPQKKKRNRIQREHENITRSLKKPRSHQETTRSYDAPIRPSKRQQKKSPHHHSHEARIRTNNERIMNE